MSAFEQLPPDQRATLSLVLRRRKSYAEVAELLELDPRVVHDRAHAGLAVLAPALARAVPERLRQQVGDYLLGQQDDEQAASTREQIASSAPAREWAKALAVELVHVTADQLPEIPEPAPEPRDRPTAEDRRAPRAADRASRALDEEEPGRRVSRRGGFAVLALIAVIVIVVVIIVISSGKGGGKLAAESTKSGGTPASETETQTETATSTTSTESASSAAGSSGKSHVEKEISLTAPHGGKATGGVIFGSEGEKHAFLLAAKGLEQTNGFKYVAWLVNSKGEAYGLGVAPEVSSSGELNAGGALPSDAADYDRIELTRNTEAKPKEPGEVVLEGAFKLG